jgi:hypothetical protein
LKLPKYVGNVLIGATAVVFAGGSYLLPDHDKNGPVLTAAVELVAPKAPIAGPGELEAITASAVNSLSSAVARLSHPEALQDAFRSYYAYKAAHPKDVKKPYLYFVDYGLSSNTPRGYVFDMAALKIVDGPFMVAAGRGSKANAKGIPTKFSNASGSAATSLGLYLTRNTYDFTGKSAGHRYSSIGLRLLGLSDGFNDNAFVRGVVAHGAPYVTSARAGRSEGCPAMEPTRAKRLLPLLANGSMVFLFAPNETWMNSDQWVNEG